MEKYVSALNIMEKEWVVWRKDKHAIFKTNLTIYLSALNIMEKEWVVWGRDKHDIFKHIFKQNIMQSISYIFKCSQYYGKGKGCLGKR